MERMEEFLINYGSLDNNNFIDHSNGWGDERKGKIENNANLFEVIMCQDSTFDSYKVVQVDHMLHIILTISFLTLFY